MGFLSSVYALTYNLEKENFGARSITILGIKTFSKSSRHLVEDFKKNFVTLKEKITNMFLLNLKKPRNISSL